jgi:hypothetical protein
VIDRPGDRVDHGRYGPGTVSRVEGQQVWIRYDCGEEVHHIGPLDLLIYMKLMTRIEATAPEP